MLEKEKELRHIEAMRLREQWEKDVKEEILEKEKMKQSNKRVYQQIEDFNKKEEEIKTNKLKIEKEKDKELINAILQKERALDDIDKKEKERKKEEFHQNKKYLEYIMNQKKEAVFDFVDKF